MPITMISKIVSISTGVILTFLASAVADPGSQSIGRPPLSQDSDPCLRILEPAALPLRAEARRIELTPKSGKILAGLISENRIAVIDPASGKTNLELELDRSRWDISPSEDLIVGMSASPTTIHPVLQLASISDGGQRWAVKIPFYPEAIRFSMDGDRVVVVSQESRLGTKVFVLDAKDGAVLHEVSAPKLVQGFGLPCVAMPDDQHVIIVTNEETRRLAVINTQENKDITADYFKSGASLAIGGNEFFLSRNGARLLTISTHDTDSSSDVLDFAVWNIARDCEPNVLLHHDIDSTNEDAHYRSGRLSDDGTLCAMSACCQVELYDIGTGAIPPFQLNHGGNLVALSQSAHLLVTTDEKHLHIFRLADDLAVTGSNPYAITEIVPGTLARQSTGPLIAGSDDTNIFVWNSETGQEVHRFTNPSNDTCVRTVKFHPKNDFLFTGDGQAIWCWPLSSKDGSSPKRMQHWDESSRSPLTLQFADDGRSYIASRGSRVFLTNLAPKIFQTPVGLRPLIFEKTTDLSGAIAYSGDGKNLALVSEGNTIDLYSLGPEKLNSQAKLDFTPIVALSHDAQLAAFSPWNQDGSLHVMDIPSGKTIVDLHPAKMADTSKRDTDISCITFSSNKNLLAVAIADEDTPSYEMEIWDLKTAELRKSIKTNRGKIQDVIFGPEDKTLCVLNGDSSIQIFDLAEDSNAPPSTSR